jgi:hypothetical protein
MKVLFFLLRVQFLYFMLALTNVVILWMAISRKVETVCS